MYKEVIGDIFENVKDKKMSGVFYGQCISNDFAMGAGIAKQFNKHFNTKSKLLSKKAAYDSYCKKYYGKDDFVTGIIDDYKFGSVGKVILVDNVFCLITKEKYYEKPTLETFAKTVERLYEKIDFELTFKNLYIRELRVPMLGCGLDKLNWEDVKPILVKLSERLHKLNVDLIVYIKNG